MNIILISTRPPSTSTLFPYTTLFRSRPYGGNRGNRSEHDNSATVEEVTCSLCAVFRDLPDERSEEHTSELQSRRDLVCRLLLEKKNQQRRRSVGRARIRARGDSEARA